LAHHGKACSDFADFAAANQFCSNQVMTFDEIDSGFQTGEQVGEQIFKI